MVLVLVKDQDIYYWQQLKFVGIINARVNSYAPLYKRAAGSKKSRWISKETKKLLKKCDRAWSAYKRNKCTKLFAAYKKSKEQNSYKYQEW